MTISDALIGFVKAHEGLRLNSYQDSGSTWTIGYGSTGSDIIKGLTWTEPQAVSRLLSDLQKSEDQVQKLLKRKINDGMMNALIDFTYNLGPQAIASSHLLQCVNAGDDIGAAKAFLVWDHIGQNEIKGLLIRRLEEATMYLKG